MKSNDLNQIQTAVEATYDLVAADYAKNFSAELEHKPFDRKMLDWMVERVSNRGPICDLGCGPGHIARYISERGGSVRGIDLSSAMVKEAQSLHPGIRFIQGDMLALKEVSDNSFAGLVAFYAIVNTPPDDLPTVFCEMSRVLRPGGELLLTFHIGTETRHLDEWWDKKVAIDFYFYETEPIKELLLAARFEPSEVMERDPYSAVEYPSRRAYIFARKLEEPID